MIIYSLNILFIYIQILIYLLNNSFNKNKIFINFHQYSLIEFLYTIYLNIVGKNFKCFLRLMNR